MVTHSFPEKYAEILRKFNEKGWDLYLASRNNEEVVFKPEEVMRTKPVSELENLSGYLIWPKNYAFGDETALQAVAKKQGAEQLEISITIPRKGARLFPKFRNVLNGTPEQEEIPIYPGEKFHIMCFQLLTEEVDSQGAESPPIFMPLDMFIESLDSLPDISRWVA